MHRMGDTAPRLIVGIMAVIGLIGCGKNYTAYALTSTGQIIEFTTNKPTSISNKVTVSGLSSGVSLVQLAYRPSTATTTTTATLYAVTSDNELCTVDPTTGAATLVSGSQFITDALSNVSIAFDPVNDELRVTATSSASSTGRENLRVSPTDGTLIAATKTLDYADSTSGSPQINGLTYTNPVAGASSTTLYGLDVASQKLVRVGSSGTSSGSDADAGAVHPIGSPGVTFSANLGFAVAPQDGTAYATLAATGSGAEFYTIDLGSGTATLVGTVHDSDYTLISLAIVP